MNSLFSDSGRTLTYIQENPKPIIMWLHLIRAYDTDLSSDDLLDLVKNCGTQATYGASIEVVKSVFCSIGGYYKRRCSFDIPVCLCPIHKTVLVYSAVRM